MALFRLELMPRDDSVFLIESQKTTLKFFKMTKTRTAMFLVTIIVCCALIFSLTEAYPTEQPNDNEDSDLQLGNNSRLVITHVVKTIEFEVGIVDDNGTVDENATESDGTEFYETDIQLLNVDLLKEVVNKAEEIEEEEEEEEMPPFPLKPLNIEPATVVTEAAAATEGPANGEIPEIPKVEPLPLEEATVNETSTQS